MTPKKQPATTADVPSMSAEEFARRLREWTTHRERIIGSAPISQDKSPKGRPKRDRNFAFFLGAGCSVSSGIRTAAVLVEQDWLPRLCHIQGGDERDPLGWAEKNLTAKGDYPGFDKASPAASYGAVIERLFLHPEDRQREIEELCVNRRPNFGYATLARLMEKWEGCFNVVLTTNFDDLVADAFYSFTESYPLVIQHESLATFIRPSRSRPLVVKLHGDHRLSPQNTGDETRRLRGKIEKNVRSLLYDRGLVFIGYGGNDLSIYSLLDGLPKDALPHGVYWVSQKTPDCRLTEWLRNRNVTWVQCADFDRLMMHIQQAFQLGHPQRQPFERVFAGYMDRYLESRQIGDLAFAPEEASSSSGLERQLAWRVRYWLQRNQRRGVGYADAFADPEERKRQEYAYFQRYRSAVGRSYVFGRTSASYGRFMHRIQKDPGAALHLLDRAITEARNVKEKSLLLLEAAYIEAFELDNTVSARTRIREALALNREDPASRLRNVGFSFATGDVERGRVLLDDTDPAVWSQARPLLRLEGNTYLYLHGRVKQRPGAFRELSHALRRGHRLDFNIHPNVQRAIDQKHADHNWLGKLEEVLVGRQPANLLEGWRRWDYACARISVGKHKKARADDKRHPRRRKSKHR